MRIEMPRYMERFGAVKFYDIQRVLELSGGKTSGFGGEVPGTINISSSDLEEIEANMVIIIPVKNENPKILEGVLSGIPHDAFVIVVSNSRREPIDRYRIELDTL
ncbi:MAG: mannosyl-3-phosphoglycerate synthase, partial [Staphylothermus sp.]|nr:mannosyl-3-phosphoglycerate synthase [Staphylothermus sp.]